jgi:predicted MFS family arabinose efflux permease
MTLSVSGGDAASSSAAATDAAVSTSDRLPMSGLLSLAAAGFVTVLTEAMPAGLLPQIGDDLGVSAALVGQLVSIYAIGSLVAAIPLTTLTQGMRRKPLLLTAIGGFVVVNTVTALSTNYALTLAARFVAGVFAGLLWALLAGYASRMAPAHLRGRAIAVSMMGTAIALSLGIPAGTWLGVAVGWRVAFGIMSGLTLLLIGWAWFKLPDFPGQPAHRRLSLAHVFALPGVRAVLFVTLVFVLAHNILFTYIAPFLAAAGMGARVDLVLLVFGLTSLVGTSGVGLLVDRWLREMTLLITLSFAACAIALGLWGAVPFVVYAAAALWGLAYSGAPTLFQTASAKSAGEAADVAQSMIVTVWNAAIAGGGIFGGVLLGTLGVASFPWTIIVLLGITLIAIWSAKCHGFPASRGRDTAAAPCG